MTSEAFDPLAYARREMSPLLARLVELTAAPGTPAQNGFFAMLLRHIDGAREPADLAGAFFNLSTAAFLGFDHEPEVAALLDRLLERAELVSEALSIRPGERH